MNLVFLFLLLPRGIGWPPLRLNQIPGGRDVAHEEISTAFQGQMIFSNFSHLCTEDNSTACLTELLGGLGAQRDNQQKRALSSCFRIQSEKRREMSCKCSLPFTHPSSTDHVLNAQPLKGRWEKWGASSETLFSDLIYTMRVNFCRLLQLTTFPEPRLH